MTGVDQRNFVPPPDATELLLVRHGASAAAFAGEPFPTTDGHGDPPLSDVGHAQAALVAERLRASERIARVFVTTLVRTAATAAPLLGLLGDGAEPVVLADLREVHLGDWEGGEFRLRAHAGDPIVAQVLQEENWELIPGAESMEGFAARVRDGVERAVELTGPGSAAAVFTHGGVIAEVCRQATGSRPLAFLGVDNCSITRLVVFSDGRWLLRGFNDTAHLAR